MITLTVNGEQVDCYNGDIVKDTIETSVGTVPFEWSTGFAPEQAIYAIEQFINGTPVEVQSTGQGWIIDLASETHPQAEINTIDFMSNLVNFRWIDSAYTGDCAAQLVFTVETTPAEVAGAITALL
jgi:hypothetical protein